MHHATVVDFKQQQLAVPGFGTVHHQIVQLHALADRVQRHAVLVRKRGKRVHEAGLVLALPGLLVHAGVDVMDHPVGRHRHMADKGLTGDKRDADFSEMPLGIAVVHKRRHEELGLLQSRQVQRDILGALHFLQIYPGL